MSRRSNKFAKEQMIRLIEDIKLYTNANIKNVSETGTAIFLENITIEESLLLRHLYSSRLYDFNWSDNEKNINFRGF